MALWTGFLVYRDRLGEWAEEVDVEADNSHQALGQVEVIAQSGEYDSGYVRLDVRRAVGIVQVLTI